MNLRKAIEIAENHVKISKLDYLPDVRDAIKLLIEAGKRLRSNRSHITTEAWILLPGETKD